MHYCELEEILTSRRRRKSSRHAERDIPGGDRLHLLTNTIRENSWLGSQVQFLKLPYQTREGCKADLARAVAGCPNLRFVDLPEGFYSGDANCSLLRQELLAHCPDLRRIKYDAGSEPYFQQLAQRQWQAIEILELKKLRVEPATLRIVLASLPTLHELSISSLLSFTDEIFTDAAHLPPFPPLQALSISKCAITSSGLTRYLEAPQNREVLTTLFLKETGVTVPSLASLLWSATHLLNLTYIQSVSSPLGLEPIPPLQSLTLQTLNYEITPSDSSAPPSFGLPNPTDSYYAHLTRSLLSHSLPALRSLYVRDPSLPTALLLSPPQPAFAEPPRPQSLPHPLEVYTKALDEADWLFHTLAPSSSSSSAAEEQTRRRASASAGRPLSYAGAARGLGPQWGAERGARRSVVVGNGFGGFLAVPEREGGRRGSEGARLEAARPVSPGLAGFWRRGSGSGGDRRSRVDLWR